MSIIFVDLDGVLTDYDKAFKEISGGITYDEYKDKYSKTKCHQLVNSYGKDWWADMEWMPDGKELWKYINNNFLYIKILSACGKPKEELTFPWDGKMEWLEREIPSLGNDDIILLADRELKYIYCKDPNDILIDDDIRNIKDWKNAGGIGILHEDTKNTIDQLKEHI